MAWRVEFLPAADKAFGKLDRKYRIGDYRLVCDIQDRTQTILVVAIGDRKDVYRWPFQLQTARCRSTPHNSYMGRLILIGIAVFILVWLLRRALGARGAGDKTPDQTGELKGDLVNCAHCGVNLPKAEARSAGGRHYCSEEHWRLGPRDG